MRERLRALRDSTDEGVTLTELIVAMGIFTTVLLVSLAATVTMSHNTVRAQVVADTALQVRNVHQRLDKEVRYASDINKPDEVSGDFYIEYLIPATAATGDPLCVQWRYKVDAKELQRRQWHPLDPSGVSGWQTLVTELRNDLADPKQTPFRFEAAGQVTSDGPVRMHESMGVYLDAGPGDLGDARGSQLDVDLVAMNALGNSDDVCLGGGVQRP